MISACELCAKIAVETALRDEAMRVAKMQAAKTFAEKVIAPILESLTEVPDHHFIGYRIHDSAFGTLYQSLSEWKKGVTSFGNPMRSRNLEKPIGFNLKIESLDYEALNQYLAEFGFQLSWEVKWVCTTEYSTSTKDSGRHLDFLYISMTCPLEDC